MRIFSRNTLSSHWRKPGRQDSEGPLRTWHRAVHLAQWRSPAEVRENFRSADFVGERVVFNIGGNKYRLVAFIDYARGAVYIKFAGTHAEYDAVNVKTIGKPEQKP